MLCTLILVFDGTEGVRSSFSCAVLSDSFSAVPRALSPVFMFCASLPVLGCTEGVGSNFHILRSRTHFRRYRGCQIPFSCFSLPDSFLTVPRAPGPAFKFCPSGLIFDGIIGVGPLFRVLLFLTHFPAGPRASGSRFPVFRSRTHFQRY
jgi:hypothetical protein